MSRIEMVYKVAHERGLEDEYTLKIARLAESSATDKEVKQMMFDILLGIDSCEE
jgi:hypothetical protein